MGRETWHSVEWEKDKLASTSTVRPSIGPFARVAVIVFTFLFEGLTPFVYYQSHELNVPASLPTELHAASQLIPTACVHIYGAIFITCLSPLQPKEDQKQLFNVDPSMMTGGLRRYFGRFFCFRVYKGELQSENAQVSLMHGRCSVAFSVPRADEMFQLHFSTSHLLIDKIYCVATSHHVHRPAAPDGLNGTNRSLCQLEECSRPSPSNYIVNHSSKVDQDDQEFKIK